MQPPEYLCLLTPMGKIWPIEMRSSQGTFWAPAKPVIFKNRVLTSPSMVERTFQTLPKMVLGRIVYALPGGGEYLGSPLPIDFVNKYQSQLARFKAAYDDSQSLESTGDQE